MTGGRWPIWIVFGLALALRLAGAAVFQGLDAPPDLDAQPDQIDYEQLAFQMSIGDGYSFAHDVPTAHRPPGTSLALLPVYAIAGRSFAWGRVWFCLLSALTCAAVGWLGTLCFGRMVGLAAATWLAVYPGHFYYPMHFVSEVPYGLWLVLACGFTIASIQRNERAGMADVIAGVLWGLATLTRPQMIFIVPLAGLFLVFHRRWLRQLLPRLAIQACVVALVLTPWLVRNEIVMGKPTLSTVGAYTFWGSHNDVVLTTPALRGSWVRTSDLVDADHPFTGSEIEREAAAWKYGMAFVTEHWSEMPGLVLMKLWRLVSPLEETPNRPVFWSFAIAWILTAPWVALGIALSLRRQPVAASVLLLSVLSTVVTAMVFYGSPRFRDSIVPILIVFAAYGLVDLVTPWTRALSLRRLRPHDAPGS
jgi:4-amino-4-deoxy-L-arabinose transferase-like glycosyltransferase